MAIIESIRVGSGHADSRAVYDTLVQFARRTGIVTPVYQSPSDAGRTRPVEIFISGSFGWRRIFGVSPECCELLLQQIVGGE